jgi:hypothetical protein
MEGDAFTFQTMAALKLRQLGHPEFYDQMTDSESKTIKEYLANHPPESFKDEQEMARGIFTHLQLNGLKRYDANYFANLNYSLQERPNVGDAIPPGTPRLNTAVPITTLGNETLGKLYGAELMNSTSLNALRTGIMQSYTPFDRQTIRLAERLTANAGSMTQEDYTKNSDSIQARIRSRNESYMKSARGLHRDGDTQDETRPSLPKKTNLLAKEPVTVKTPVAVPQPVAVAAVTVAGPQPVKPATVKSVPGEFNAKAGKTTGVADVALKIAEGNYAGASLSGGQQVLLSKNTYEAAAEMAKSIAPVAKALGQFAKRIPVIGAAVTVGYVGVEVVGDLVDGNYGKAMAATAAGSAEVGGNMLGFGVGDGAREVVRSSIIASAGDEYSVNKSGLRTLGERTVELGNQYLADPKPKTHTQVVQADLLKDGGIRSKNGTDLTLNPTFVVASGGQTPAIKPVSTSKPAAPLGLKS